uniref:Uncharacterized protein n=1 Tax=Cucumis melo TaxID=3656 RepID=A0A9I9D4G5_CUCME
MARPEGRANHGLPEGAHKAPSAKPLAKPHFVRVVSRESSTVSDDKTLFSLT